MKSFQKDGQFHGGSIVNRQWLSPTLPATVGIWSMSSIEVEPDSVVSGGGGRITRIHCKVINPRAISLNAGLFDMKNGALDIEKDMGKNAPTNTIKGRVSAWPTIEYMHSLKNPSPVRGQARWRKDDPVWVFDPIFEVTYDTYDGMKSVNWPSRRGVAQRGIYYEQNKTKKKRIDIINTIRRVLNKNIAARLRSITKKHKQFPSSIIDDKTKFTAKQTTITEHMKEFGTATLLAWDLHEYWGNVLPKSPKQITNTLGLIGSVLKPHTIHTKIDPLWIDVFNITQSTVGQIHYNNNPFTTAAGDVAKKTMIPMITMRSIGKYKKVQAINFVTHITTLPKAVNPSTPLIPMLDVHGPPKDAWKGQTPKKAKPIPVVVVAGQPNKLDLVVIKKELRVILPNKPIGDIEAIMTAILTQIRAERNAVGHAPLTGAQMLTVRRLVIGTSAEKLHEHTPNYSYSVIKKLGQHRQAVVAQKTNPHTDQIFSFPAGSGGIFRLHNSYTSSFGSAQVIGQSPNGKHGLVTAEVFGYIAINALSRMGRINNIVHKITGGGYLEWINENGAGRAVEDNEIRFSIPFDAQINFDWETEIGNRGATPVGTYQLKIHDNVKRILDADRNRLLPVIWSIYKLAPVTNIRGTQVFGIAGGMRTYVPRTGEIRVKLEFFLLQDS